MNYKTKIASLLILTAIAFQANSQSQDSTNVGRLNDDFSSIYNGMAPTPPRIEGPAPQLTQDEIDSLEDDPDPSQPIASTDPEQPEEVFNKPLKLGEEANNKPLKLGEEANNKPYIPTGNFEQGIKELEQQQEARKTQKQICDETPSHAIAIIQCRSGAPYKHKDGSFKRWYE